jgi:hypothetical protein
LLPKTALWLGEFTAELLAFPSGRHDDQVDALSQFLEWLSRYRWSMTRRARIEARDRGRRERRAGRARGGRGPTWSDRVGRGMSNEALLARCSGRISGDW